MKRLVPFIILSLGIASCGPSRLMSLSVVEPSPVTLSPEIRRVAVMNRSQPERGGRILDAVDKLFTLEGANLDKAGSEAAIDALIAELSVSKRFDEVKLVPVAGRPNSNPGGYAPMLLWSEVEEICRVNDADLLFSLELFDTDSKIDYAAVPVKVKTPVGAVPAVEQEATMTTSVKTGWRIYDPGVKSVLDESAVAKQLVYRGRGLNPLLAAKALIERKEAVRQVGNRAGLSYAYSVIPAEVRVSRQYYVKGSEGLKMARRRAQSGNWKGAAEIWREETRAYKRKVAGRATYNMAIYGEINGQLDEAINWAQRSYEDYNIKRALHYVKTLQGRKERLRILEYQQSAATAASSGAK